MNEWEIQVGHTYPSAFFVLHSIDIPKHSLDSVISANWDHWHPKHSPIFFQCHQIEIIDIPKPFTNLLIISSNWDDWFSQTILTVSVQCSPIILPRTKNLLEVPKALAAHIDHHQPAICNSLSFYSFPKNNWNIDRVLNFPVFEPFLKRNPVKLKCLKL